MPAVLGGAAGIIDYAVIDLALLSQMQEWTRGGADYVPQVGGSGTDLYFASLGDVLVGPKKKEEVISI